MPKDEGESKTSKFNRATQARLKNDFEKALIIYNSIVSDYPEEPEGYWGLILCKYGIEYVNDPKTGEKKPTCHRTETDSIIDDIDYINCISYASDLAKKYYQAEAAKIDKLQKEILVVSQREKPFDIFICYKETTDDGRNKTKDSLIAEKLYNILTKKDIRSSFQRLL